MKIEILETAARATAAGLALGCLIAGCSGCAEIRALEQTSAAEHVLEVHYAKAIGERNFYEQLANKAHALLAAAQRKDRDDVLAAYVRGRAAGHGDVRCSPSWPALDVESGAKAGEILVKLVTPATTSSSSGAKK